MGDTKLLNIHDVMAETGLSRHTVYRLARMSESGRPGGLPVVRVGRILRFPRKALEAWIDNGGADRISGV
jgi:excisionase family DNA binding protein